MNEHHHGIVWIDHREARIFLFGAADAEPVVVDSHAKGRHLQHRANVTGSGHRGIDTEFFGRVAEALADVGAILVTGPGNARMEFKNYLAERHADISKRIAAVEPLDHPHDAALVALARKFFHADDRMRASAP